MTQRFSRPILVLSAAMLLSFTACKKDEADKPATTAEPATQPAVLDEPKEMPETPPVEDDEEAGDYFYVEISHAEAKEDDPVKVSFPGLRVASTSFDLENLEGGTATLEIDLMKIDSGIPKRDGHLASPDYFDSTKHPKAVIMVKDVKKKDGMTYTATADVEAHGVKKSWPVEFMVVDSDESSITIEAEHKFDRLDFEIGKAEGDSVATEVLAKLKVTLQNP